MTGEEYKDQLPWVVGVILAALAWVGRQFSRLRGVEDRLQVIEVKINNFDRWLEKIEGKLDKVIER